MKVLLWVATHFHWREKTCQEKRPKNGRPKVLLLLLFLLFVGSRQRHSGCNERPQFLLFHFYFLFLSSSSLHSFFFAVGLLLSLFLLKNWIRAGNCCRTVCSIFSMNTMNKEATTTAFEIALMKQCMKWRGKDFAWRPSFLRLGCCSTT